MCPLHIRRLGQAQVQLFLEVFVHHVDHPIAESPKEKQRTDQDKREHHVVPVLSDKKAIFLGVCIHGFFRKELYKFKCLQLRRNFICAAEMIYFTQVSSANRRKCIF